MLNKTNTRKIVFSGRIEAFNWKEIEQKTFLSSSFLFTVSNQNHLIVEFSKCKYSSNYLCLCSLLTTLKLKKSIFCVLLAGWRIQAKSSSYKTFIYSGRLSKFYFFNAKINATVRCFAINISWSIQMIFNRPGVAGAVLQAPLLLTDWLI